MTVATNPTLALTDDELRASSPFQWLARRYTPDVAEKMLREHERIVLHAAAKTATLATAIFGERIGRAMDGAMGDAVKFGMGAVLMDGETAAHIPHQELRAPVADERAAFEAAFTKEIGIELCADGTFSSEHDRAVYDAAKWAWETRTALASAPVAKEAQPVAKVRHFNYSGVARNGFSQEAVLNDDAPSLPDGTLLYAAPQASEAVAAEALEVAREALMEIADLADVDADDRSVIVNRALTKIDRITALSAQSGAQENKA